MSRDPLHIGDQSNGRSVMVVDDHITSDIVDLLLSKDKTFNDQVTDLSDQLKGLPARQQAYNIWAYVRRHAKYRPDRSDNQKLKSPARLMAEGEGDCKSFSLFEASVLRNLGIPYKYRFVSFDKRDSTPTHVYIVATPKGERPIIMDAVLDRFDKEKPYTFKKDKPMAVRMLTGINDFNGGIGKKHHFFQNLKKGIQIDEKKAAKDVQKAKADVHKALNDVVNFVRKFNPGSVLVRNGLLIAAKTNFLNFAGRLHLGFLTPEAAKARGYDMTEWTKLHNIALKWKDKFHNDLGGDSAEFQKAVTSGKRALNGMGCPGVGAAGGDDGALLAAATTLIGIIGAELKKVDSKKMVANAHTKGYSEAAAQDPGSVSQDQLNQLTDGANSLAAQSGSKEKLPMPKGGKKKSLFTGKNLILAALAAGVVYVAAEE